MQKWEKALNKFMERYIHEPWFQGALLCGSYATGNQNQFSDVDVTIVGSDNMGFQEKSNCYVDGILMEYIINPISKYKEYFDNCLENHHHTNQNMFVYGKILYDKNGAVKKLRDLAVRQIKKPFKPMSEYNREFRKYHLWDKYDELQSLERSGMHTDLQYWSLVDLLITSYYDFKNLPHIPHSKIEKILTDKNFAKRYHIQATPTPAFTEKLLVCMNAKSKSDKKQAIDNLYKFVMKSGGGFDIGKFRGYNKLKKQ